MKSPRNLLQGLILAAIVLLAAPGWQNEPNAGELQVNWADNSNNEDGFKIERKSGTNGTYVQIVTTGANVTSYRDSNLITGYSYCYRLLAFNAFGSSAYSDPACATAAPTFTLSVTKAGTGSGTVTSTPAGINCGSTCSALYNSGTLVTLSATPATGSTFAGWTGSGCTNGAVTMNANQTCTATFNSTSQKFTLSVSVIKTVTSSGTGNGIVTSAPAGINCGSTCSAIYNSGTLVTLTAAAATGSTFAGWSGSGCANGAVTMNTNQTCTATFNPQAPQSFSLSISKAGTGIGTVTSAPSGINCGSTCSALYSSGTLVTLTATPATGSTFAGWTGSGCANGAATMTASIGCTATFQTGVSLAARIGIFRPGTGEWFLDQNGNRQWDGCNVDVCLNSFGQAGDVPVIGNWSRNGASNIGIFDSATATWQLDTNGNGVWDGCAVDTCVSSFGQPADLPVTREIGGARQSSIGTFTPQTTVKGKGKNTLQQSLWKFDLNGNGKLDSCSIDACHQDFGGQDDLPVVGDWNSTGTDEIGVFQPGTGQWLLDHNGNGKWDGCHRDKCLGPFGVQDDLPVVGDWDGAGKVRIGVFRPSTGQWLLDMNGSGKWDGCTIDTCIDSFGQEGDLPVVGKW
ncbi:MAG: fibronectin type III domain-containing protein [Candidatus Binatia bacterium]